MASRSAARSTEAPANKGSGSGPEQIPRKEREIGGPLSKPPHEIRKPVFAEGDVDPQTVTVANELPLQVGANSIQHLKFELILRDVALGGEANRRGNHAGVVRANPMIDAAGQKRLHQLDVVSIHIRFGRKGNFRRLLIGSLAQADAASVGQ